MALQFIFEKESTTKNILPKLERKKRCGCVSDQPWCGGGGGEAFSRISKQGWTGQVNFFSDFHQIAIQLKF